MVWVFTSDGGLGFASQIRCPLPMGKSGSSWSFGDVAGYIVLMLDLAKELWKTNGYWGDARALASLNVADLPLAMDDGAHAAHCHMCGSENTFDLGRVSFAPSRRPCGSASAAFSASSVDSERTKIVAFMLNQILRSMGHSASMEDLNAGVANLAAALSEVSE